ncbi:hypothetical protein Ancab_018511 [Ancistrocladus abbreviatus]
MMPTGDFKAFESTKSAMMEIIGALNCDANKIIGIYGMGGVGKTSLMKAVAKQAKSKMFDEVVIATVSQNPDRNKIQCEVGEGLGLRLPEETASIRALRLAARLKQEKSVLLILDDVWERLDLALVGIPCEDHNGLKIAITTRSLDVCSEMGCNVNIKVETLSEQESWDLFKQVAGNIVDFPDLHDVAKQVAKECGGLPIALVTVGRVLRNKELSIWLDAARGLRASRPMNIKGMHDKVFSCLKLSFDQVQSEEEKLCYLYCSLFPEDYDVEIEDLVRYGIGEGLFSDMETLDEVRNRMQSIISNLKASCLLVNSNKKGCIKMHDVFRDLAISIATSNDYSFMVKASSGLKEWPARIQYALRISMIDNEFGILPSQREYPELLLLLLQNNRNLKVIPDDFFTGMTALEVLDLSHIPNMVKLPTSLSCLTNLKTLSVENNHLKDISVLGELESLEILSLRRSSFALFPEQIGRLTKLRLLDLTESQIGVVPPNVISSLSRLEELYMWQSYSHWEVEETESEERATLAEVLSLQHINTLHIHISNINCLTKDLRISWLDLKKFHIQIGGNFRLRPASRTSMSFDMPDQDTIQKPIIDWVKKLVKKTNELSLVCGKDLWILEQLQAEDVQSIRFLDIQRSGLQNGFSLDRISHLTELHVSSCSHLGEIFLPSVSYPANPVPCQLKTMHLEYLPSLKTIWTGVVLSSCFESLTYVKVEYCMHLMNLFSSPLAEALKQLESLEVSDCEGMETLISSGNEVQADVIRDQANLVNKHGVSSESEDNKTFFPRLQSLKLVNLKNMRSFTKPWMLLDFPSLQHLTVTSCPDLKKLPFGPKSLQMLKEIKTERKWFKELGWDNRKTKLHLQNCFTGA